MKVFAHKYKVSHIKRRKIMKRAAKDGLCKLILITKDGFLYDISNENFNKLKSF